MSKRDELIAKYAADLKDKCGVTANMDLLTKLGLKDSPALDAGIASVIELYGKSNRNKYRAVVYYLLAKHFKKEAVYK